MSTIPLTSSNWITDGDIDSSGLQKVIDAIRLTQYELLDLINAIPVRSFDEIVRQAVTAWEQSTELKARVKEQVDWGQTDAVHQFSGRLLVSEAELRTVRLIAGSLYSESKEVSA